MEIRGCSPTKCVLFCCVTNPCTLLMQCAIAVYETRGITNQMKHNIHTVTAPEIDVKSIITLHATRLVP